MTDIDWGIIQTLFSACPVAALMLIYNKLSSRMDVLEERMKWIINTLERWEK